MKIKIMGTIVQNNFLDKFFPNGKTSVYGIIGNPISHSVSPYMQTQAFLKLKINAIYVPFEVQRGDISQVINSLKTLNIKGINVTVPYKEVILPYLDEIDQDALNIGSVNTIKIENKIARGFNTDAPGFILALKEENISVKNKNVIILGAGGTAKALAYILLKEKAKSIFLVNRTLEKAKKLEDSLKKYGNIKSYPLKNEILKDLIKQSDILINTTSIGLKKDDPPLFNYNFLKENKNLVVVDVIYFLTPLLKKAQEFNLKTIDGKGMLLYQGALAFEIWTGKKAPIDVMKKALDEILN